MIEKSLDSKIIKQTLIIPVYKNEENIPTLLNVLNKLATRIGNGFEVVFVVDGSPDKSYQKLKEQLPTLKFFAQLILLSRNFGSFTAIRTGLEYANGSMFAVMAADLQESPHLIEKFFSILNEGTADIVFGQRVGRKDAFINKILAGLYWWIYQKIVMPEIPVGGVDIFACNDEVRTELLKFQEPNSSLIAQLFWVGFRRVFVPYERLERKYGKSAWNLKRRIKYMLDSIFSFSDFPIMFVLWLGLVSLSISFIIGSVTLIAKLFGWIDVPGYTAMILVTLFLGSTILTTQGLVGCYLWRAFENTKKRPLSIVQNITKFQNERK